MNFCFLINKIKHRSLNYQMFHGPHNISLCKFKLCLVRLKCVLVVVVSAVFVVVDPDLVVFVVVVV